MAQISIAKEEAEILIQNHIKHVVSTLRAAIEAIENPSKSQIDMEGYRAKIYVNPAFLKVLDVLDDMQLQLRALKQQELPTQLDCNEL